MSRESTDTEQKVLFIAGAGRSGTTLISQALGGLPGFVSVGEMVHVFSRGVIGDQLCGCGAAFSLCPFWQSVFPDPLGEVAIDELDQDLKRVSRYRSGFLRTIRRGPDPSVARSRHLDRILVSMYREIGERGGPDSVVVDSSKSIPYLTYLLQLDGLDITVLHVVRDPRSVATSWKRRMERPEIVDQPTYMPVVAPFQSALIWMAKNTLMEMFRIRTRTLRVSRLYFENFVRDPRNTLVDIALRFGGTQDAVDGLMADRRTIRIRPTHSVSGNPMRFDVGDVAVLEDANWRSGLTFVQGGVVSLVAAPLMILYGYCRPIRIRHAGTDSVQAESYPGRRNA